MKKMLVMVCCMMFIALTARAEKPETEYSNIITTDSFWLKDADMEKANSAAKEMVKLCGKSGRSVQKWEVIPFVDNTSGKIISLSVRLYCVSHSE